MSCTTVGTSHSPWRSLSDYTEETVPKIGIGGDSDGYATENTRNVSILVTTFTGSLRTLKLCSSRRSKYNERRVAPNRLNRIAQSAKIEYVVDPYRRGVRPC